MANPIALSVSSYVHFLCKRIASPKESRPAPPFTTEVMHTEHYSDCYIGQGRVVRGNRAPLNRLYPVDFANSKIGANSSSSARIKSFVV